MADVLVAGTIRKLFVDKHFGFVTRVGGSDVFIHQKDHRAVWPSLTEGAAVRMAVIDTEKGPRASHLELA